jgi:hypothetical protein
LTIRNEQRTKKLLAYLRRCLIPAHSFDPNEKQNLARLLLAIVLQSGGELRVGAVNYDTLDKGRLLVVDYDREKAEIVLRSTTDFAKAIVVTPEAYNWTKPLSETPQARAQVQAQENVRRRTMRTDEELAEFEEQRGRESTLAREAEAGPLPKTPVRVAPPPETT